MGGIKMAMLTSIKDAFSAKQYKFEIQGLMEENKKLKHIKLTPTQMSLSQILAKTKDLETELEGYDNMIQTKTKAIKELNTEYRDQAIYQTKEFEEKSNEYDNLIDVKGKDLEDKSLEYDNLIESKRKEYEDLILLKATELEDKSEKSDNLIEKKRKEYESLIEQKSNELEEKANEYGVLIETKTKSIEKLNLEYNTVTTSIKSLKSQIVTLDNDLSMQSYGIYKPEYSSMTSEKCSTMLERIREKQMDMIKSKEAIEFKQWVVNGSIKEDTQLVDDMTEDMSKLVIRIFNDECNSIIYKVNFSNIQVIENIIKKFFDDLNRLGSITQVKIVPKYFNTKLEELYLSYEYKLKKHQESEEQVG